MTIPPAKTATTLNALKCTIAADSYTQRWFTLFILNPGIRRRLAKNTQARKAYPALQRILCLQFFVSSLLLGFLCYGLLQRNTAALVSAFVLLLLYLRLLFLKNRSVRDISMMVLGEDFQPKNLYQKTLFQICEVYSRELGIPSLVDRMLPWEQTARMGLIAAVIATDLVLPFVFKAYHSPTRFLICLLVVLALASDIVETFRSAMTMLRET